MEDIVLVGMGGHAKSVADCIERQHKYRIIGYTDVEPRSSKYDYLGTDAVIKDCFEQGIKNAAVGIGYMGKSVLREKLFKQLKYIGYSLPVIVDPTAVVSETAQIEEGTFIGKNTVVNADAKIGEMCIINDGAIIEHDCSVGDFSHVAVGTVVCGMSRIGKQSFVGANATVIQCVNIGNFVTIGAGAIVLSDVKDNSTVYGVWRKV